MSVNVKLKSTELRVQCSEEEETRRSYFEEYQIKSPCRMIGFNSELVYRFFATIKYASPSYTRFSFTS